MKPERRRASERETALNFVASMLTQVKGSWSQTYAETRKTWGEKFHIEDESKAQFDYGLAVIAKELRAVPNLFPEEQAKRLSALVSESLDRLFPDRAVAEYAKSEIREYSRVFQESLADPDSGMDTMYVIPVRLLRKWLGPNLGRFEMEFNGEKTGYIDPLLLDYMTTIVIAFAAGQWKWIRDNCDLVPDTTEQT